MPHKLYVVHGSHPCATVARALEMKGIAYKTVELPPPSHAAVMRVMFGKRTVPGLRLEDGEKISGSRAILRRLDELAPEPRLFPAGEEARARVQRAEEWGDEVLQPIARRLLWPSFARHPEAMLSYQEGSQLPPVPPKVVIALAPIVTRIERRMNHADEGNVRADLKALPAHLDRVDDWIAEGVIGGEQPNAADLQIATTLRLLMTIGDVRPLIDGRPCAELALRLFPTLPGSTPQGVLPAEWIPEPAPAR